jgi:hypothetical protein
VTPIFFTPKGWDNLAQGAALGPGTDHSGALKGRDNGGAVPPFQG